MQPPLGRRPPVSAAEAHAAPVVEAEMANNNDHIPMFRAQRLPWGPRPPVVEAEARAAPAVEAREEYRQIQDLEEWLRTNGLASASNAPLPTMDRVEERERFREFERYEKSIHDSIFAEEMQQDEINQLEREKQLLVWQDAKMNFLAANGRAVVTNVPLPPMAAACETIFAMASSLQYFQRNASIDDDACNVTDDDKKNLLFSLDDFTESSVRDFVSVVLGQQDVWNLTPDSIVECCEISHYVQNTSLFEATVKILLESIDTGNCLSLCYLADKLNIPSLFERSVGHLMHTVGSLESGSCWTDLTPDLHNRILAIKQAIQSSIHDQRRTLYFASLDEYIAIFAERCQYYRERLAEAKEQHDNLIASDGSCGKNLLDVNVKIERQERRVMALEMALAEQKKLFSTARTT